MPEFGLVNLNARLYDPMLGRFLSCDNYVQMPDNTQNFNRYSYCLNNPLKYNDPSGEFIPQLIGFALAGGLMNCAINKDFNWKYFLVGAVAGAVSAGVAQGVNVAMAGGSFWNGAIGLAKGIESTGFWQVLLLVQVQVFLVALFLVQEILGLMVVVSLMVFPMV